ncbi:MBL fold metallo-hydrolase [Gordonia sp. DT30]|uniref:MBL fold metallo-hydrolase n=1 Tax=Gordonia sp. DT30 TaxID=3416546 RepID=UPI003CFBB9FB
MTMPIEWTPTEVFGRVKSSVGVLGARAAGAAVGSLASAGLPAARAIGADPETIWREVAGSPNLVGRTFVNPEPPSAGVAPDLRVAMDMAKRPGRPTHPIRVERPRFADEVAALAVTWLGHASALVEIDGVRVLTDPVFSQRCSPSQTLGPARMHPAPVEAADLPPLDVVLISHDHYDHLDMATVTTIARTQPDVVFVTPLGVGAHLLAWGVPADRIRQADLWGSVEVTGRTGQARFTVGPARHFSGRMFDRDLTQWASWGIVGPTHRVFFSGDTGYSERFEDLGELLGPFDLTLIAVGAYDPVWPDVHVDPEEAVAIHRMVSGSAGTDAVLIPIHWGTFSLARHSWADPITRLLPNAGRNATTVMVPQPGGTIDLQHRTGTGLTDPQWWEASA